MRVERFVKKSSPIYGWWAGEKLSYNDGRIAEVGVTHSKPMYWGRHQTSKPILCYAGFHACPFAFDTAKYQVFSECHDMFLVALWGNVHDGQDKVAAEHRRYLVRIPSIEWQGAFCGLPLSHSKALAFEDEMIRLARKQLET